ncbi:MAG TPA: ribosome-binding factor A, partial [Candidatus Paceibacterota bacterium]|nr:ribosome-binding factor A [Candidatus Paceibacterota bacterium]HQC46323.1 ribosome-binding factor A [Candidatus Paceibacterota bacterium]
MSELRNEKIKQSIKEISALFIEKEAGPTSLITLTRVELSSDGKRATLMISVMPKEKEQAAFGFIKRNLGELRDLLKKHLRI